jgi:UDP-glucose 4-epimerase
MLLKYQYKRNFIVIFNPIGATSSEIENYLLSTSKLGAVYYANRFWITHELSVYGDDYPTPDGTAVRDYIHVVDLRKPMRNRFNRLLNKRMSIK